MRACTRVYAVCVDACVQTYAWAHVRVCLPVREVFVRICIHSYKPLMKLQCSSPSNANEIAFYPSERCVRNGVERWRDGRRERSVPEHVQ